MSIHPSGHATASGPERDALAQDVHATVTGIALPVSGIDLNRVRRRGQRRRTARRVLIATPVLAAVLAGGAAITHLTPSASTTPAEQRTTSTQQATDPTAAVTAAATAAFQNALKAMDPDMNRNSQVGFAENSDTGQQVGWAASYWDKRSTPQAQLVLTVSTLATGEDAYAVATGCFAASDCTTDQLGAGVRLVTATAPMTSITGDGASVEGTHSQVSAVYPDGRIVHAWTLRSLDTQAALGPAKSFDSQLITTDDLRALVTNAGLAELALPTPTPTASR